MNKFMKKLVGMFTPRRDTAITTVTACDREEAFDFSDLKGNRSSTFPRCVINDPQSKCKGTKRGAVHYIRPAGQGLSS